jgi:hypothetical protein
VWYDPWVLRQRREKNLLKHPAPKDIDESAARALEETEMFEERMKGRKKR